MKMHLCAVGRRMPQWVQAGYEEYTKRLAPQWSLQLTEINPPTRNKNSPLEKLKKQEGEKILAHIPDHHSMIALDEHGKPWDTQQLAQNLEAWQGEPISFIIGGPDGLCQEVLQKASHIWSLSPLTLPHPLVRIVLAEQLYRAKSILAGHPYHRQ